MKGTVRGLVRHVKNDIKNLKNYGIERKGQEVFIDGYAPINFELLNEALGKVARGIYYHHSNGRKKLLGRLSVVPLFIGIDLLASPDERERLMNIYSCTVQNIKEIEMLGAYQQVFSYQVIEDDDVIVINMKFYVNKVVCVMHVKT